jgi:hypothetical protein
MVVVFVNLALRNLIVPASLMVTMKKHQSQFINNPC